MQKVMLMHTPIQILTESHISFYNCDLIPSSYYEHLPKYQTQIKTNKNYGK